MSKIFHKIIHWFSEKKSIDNKKSVLTAVARCVWLKQRFLVWHSSVMQHLSVSQIVERSYS